MVGIFGARRATGWLPVGTSLRGIEGGILGVKPAGPDTLVKLIPVHAWSVPTLVAAAG
jgi:hypothetical protein